MFVLGHMGIGSKLAAPLRPGLPRSWLLVGTLLPDLLDKPLYYGLVLATGQRSAELGLISGTRTFAHTGIFLLLLTLAAFARHSKILAALALGTATHLLLDNVSDRILAPGYESSALLALVFPALGVRFGAIPFGSAEEHLHSIFKPFTMGAEAVGAAILFWDSWVQTHKAEIVARLRKRRR
jgi:hypothetical protein